MLMPHPIHSTSYVLFWIVDKVFFFTSFWVKGSIFPSFEGARSPHELIHADKCYALLYLTEVYPLTRTNY